MRTAYALIAIVICLGTVRSYGADSTQYVLELQAQVEQQQLWLHQDWIKLLHYKPLKRKLLPRQHKTYSSFVDDNIFFLSDNGSTDPRAELTATLDSLFQPGHSGDEHAQCRFPARLNWLSKHLAIDRSKLPQLNCKLYKEWSEMVQANSVVLIFPAHHLNSPSSMFGHTLLRLDPVVATERGEQQSSDWLSYGVNFGANVPASDNSMLYAYRGLTGGYPGQFIVEPYFKKIQTYNRIENRDIWEYPLNLSPQETERLVTHLWELKDINFDYFFFTENCSYRLLELLEIARPSAELTDEFIISAIPIDTIRAIKHGGFMAASAYRPALATKLKHQLAELPGRLHPLVGSLRENLEPTTEQNFQILPENQQYQVLNTAYQALRYQQTKKARDQQAAKQSLALLEKLSKYPIQDPQIISPPTSPEKGHQSKRLGIRIGRDDDRNYSELEFRMAYHSLLDNSYGFLSGAQINMGNGALRRYDDGSVKLERLDVVDIVSLTPKNTFFDQLSWRVYGGLERVDTAQGRPLAIHVTGGGGYAFDLNNTTLFALLMGRLEHNRDFDVVAEIALGPQLGWLYSTRIGNGLITASGLEFSGGEQRLEFKLEQNIVLDVNHALRLSAGRRWSDAHSATELSLGYHFFFR